MVSAEFKYNGVIDHLCDAVFQYRLAAVTDDSYTMNRHARASILSSILTLESAANALLVSLELGAKFAGELDRLPVLGKYETYLRLSEGAKPFDRGVVEVQSVQELLRARNDYVHSKIKSIPADVDDLRKQGNMVAMPLEMTGEQWPTIGITKRPMFWSADSARSALKATADFLRTVCNHANISPEDAQTYFHSRVEIGDTHILAAFDEFFRELKRTADIGVDFKFLGVSENTDK